jgi:hypothetical protein
MASLEIGVTMGFMIVRTFVSAAIIVIVAEVAKRSVVIGAMAASLPLVAVLSMVWLWRDTGDTVRLASFAETTFWFVLPSLPMFLLIPAMLRSGASFWLSLGVGVLVTAALYLLTRTALARFGLSI